VLIKKRLHYLKNYWMEKVRHLPDVQLRTSSDPNWGCAIGTIDVRGKKPAELDNFLFDKYKIHAVAIDTAGISGVRVTPNVYTSTRDLDVLVEAIHAFAKT
jgi:selenocysteine lyase/cysteine desulfurase